MFVFKFPYACNDILSIQAFQTQAWFCKPRYIIVTLRPYLISSIHDFDNHAFGVIEEMLMNLNCTIEFLFLHLF
jgi:hypothetical protein